MLGRTTHPNLALPGPKAPALLKLLELRFDAGFNDARESERRSPIHDSTHAFNQHRRQRERDPGLRLYSTIEFHIGLTATDGEIVILARNVSLLAY